VNRYEILIGKEPPPGPPDPSEQGIREVLIGKRRAGKTRELIECIRKTVEKGITPLVCLSHKEDYFIQMAGSLISQIYLTSPDRLGRESRGLGELKVFYYDDFDLVPFRRSGFHEGPFGLERYSLDRRFVEMDEIVVTCDLQEMHRYCHCYHLDSVPSSIKVGFSNWEVVDIPRRSKDVMYTFNSAFRGEFV